MYREIKTEELVPHPQNREFERAGAEWDRFQSSIRQHGVLQNLLVRPRGAGFEIIMGERRWTAARAAGLAEVPCVVNDYSDEEVVTLILVENLKRLNLDPIQEAEAVQTIKAAGLAEEIIAQRIDMEPEWVQGRLELLELKGEARAAVKARVMEVDTGRLLVQLPLEFREEAVQMVLHPSFQVVPLNHTQAADMIKAKILEPLERRERWEQKLPAFVEAARTSLRAEEPVRCADLNVQGVSFEEVGNCSGADWVSAFFAHVEWEEGAKGSAAVLAARHGAPVMVVPGSDDGKGWQAVVNWKVVRDGEKALADHLEQVALVRAEARGIEIEQVRPEVWAETSEEQRPLLALWNHALSAVPVNEVSAPEREEECEGESAEEADEGERLQAMERTIVVALEDYGPTPVLYYVANWLEQHFVPTVPEKKQDHIRRVAAEVRIAGQGALI